MDYAFNNSIMLMLNLLSVIIVIWLFRRHKQSLAHSQMVQ